MSKLIWTADWHLVDIPPRCRKDEDWYSFLDSMIKFVVNTANEKQAILGIGGDLFGKRSPNVSNYIVSMLLLNILKVKKGTRILAGNHDEYFHNFEYISKTSFGVLDAFINGNKNNGRLNYIDDLGTWFNFNEEVINPGKDIAFVHRLVFKDIKSIPPNVNACTAKELLDEFPKAKIILTGDNHHSFLYESKGRKVVNPGCLYRSDADFREYQPVVYFVDTDSFEVEEINIPDNGDVVDDNYIVEENERKDRIGAFVEGIKKNGKVSLNFLGNLEKAIVSNKKMSKETVKVIRELCEDEEK